MTLQSYYSKEDIIERLQRRFNLVVVQEEKTDLLLPSFIVPVTQVDQLVKVSQMHYRSFDLTGALATITEYVEVPDGMRWEVLFAYRGATTGISNIRYKVDSSDTNWAALSGTGTAAGGLKVGIVLNEGGKIGMMNSGNGADGAITFNCNVLEEKQYSY